MGNKSLPRISRIDTDSRYISVNQCYQWEIETKPPNYETNRNPKTTAHESHQVPGAVHRHGYRHGTRTDVLQCHPNHHHRKPLPHPRRHGGDYPVEDHRIVQCEEELAIAKEGVSKLTHPPLILGTKYMLTLVIEMMTLLFCPPMQRAAFIWATNLNDYSPTSIPITL